VRYDNRFVVGKAPSEERDYQIDRRCEAVGGIAPEGSKKRTWFPSGYTLAAQEKNRSVFTGSGCGGITCQSYHVTSNPYGRVPEDPFRFVTVRS